MRRGLSVLLLPLFMVILGSAVTPARASLLLGVGSASVEVGESGYIDVTITNTGDQDIALGGFNLALAAGGPGILLTTADYLTTDPYLFGTDGVQGENLLFDPPPAGADIAAFDISSLLEGTVLGAGQTMGLARIGFNALSVGIFSVSLLGYPETAFTDLDSIDTDPAQTFWTNGQVTVRLSSAAIPEPSTLVLMGLGLAGGAAAHAVRRSHRRPAAA